jgi:hypothetical protein
MFKTIVLAALVACAAGAAEPTKMSKFVVRFAKPLSRKREGKETRAAER